MMISKEIYRNDNKNKTYKELLKERDELLKEIRDFENGVCHDNGFIIDPAPEVVYQCNLQYLSELFILIYKKYNKEYIGLEKCFYEKDE